MTMEVDSNGNLRAQPKKSESEAEMIERSMVVFEKMTIHEALMPLDPDTALMVFEQIPTEYRGTTPKQYRGAMALYPRLRNAMGGGAVGARHFADFERRARHDLVNGTLEARSARELTFAVTSYIQEFNLGRVVDGNGGGAKPPRYGGNTHGEGSGGAHGGGHKGGYTKPTSCKWYNMPQGCKKGEVCDLPHKCSKCGAKHTRMACKA